MSPTVEWSARPARAQRRKWVVAAGVGQALLMFVALVLLGRIFFGGLADFQSTHELPGAGAGGGGGGGGGEGDAAESPAAETETGATESDPATATTASFRRDPGEYVLSPSWDINAPPQTRGYNWTITEIQGNPDGVWRTLIVIDGQFPGPLVECNEGDTLVIDIHNAGTNSTSLHWHGLYQNGSNWMDGSMGITNCPIPPGESFRYEFTVRDQYGTYWYHAHFSTTRTDGLFGPLVVHSPNEANREYDSDRVVMLHDHYHDLSSALLPTYLAPNNENAEPVPDGALVNGQNILDCSTADERSYKCDNSSATLEWLRLEKNKKHRLRFLNVGAFAEFDVEIDRHPLELIEVDGVSVQPYRLHRFKINVAQRYSVVLHADQSEDAYWLRARMIAHCFAEIPADLKPEVKAVVQYTTSESAQDVDNGNMITPTTSGWGEPMELECKDLDTTELVPVPAMPAPKADLLIPLRSNFEIGAYQLSRGFFNATSWRPSMNSPTLVQAVDGLSTDNASFATTDLVMKDAYDVARQLVIKVDGIQTIDLLIDNYDDGDHPLHLHGHRLWVLAQGHGYFNMSDYETLDVSNPLRRDTVSVEAFGWTLVRFVADNPGMWPFHCHIAWHAEAGMLMQFLASPAKVREWSVPEDVRRMCAMSEKQRGGGIEDEWFYY